MEKLSVSKVGAPDLHTFYVSRTRNSEVKVATDRSKFGQFSRNWLHFHQCVAILISGDGKCQKIVLN